MPVVKGRGARVSAEITTIWVFKTGKSIVKPTAMEQFASSPAKIRRVMLKLTALFIITVQGAWLSQTILLPLLWIIIMLHTLNETFRMTIPNINGQHEWYSN